MLYYALCKQKRRQRTVCNVQSLPECGRAVICKKIYAAFTGLTGYASAMKCHVHERTAGRWYAKFAEHGIEAIHRSWRGPKPAGWNRIPDRTRIS